MHPFKWLLALSLPFMLLCNNCFAFVSRASPNAIDSRPLRLLPLLRPQSPPLSPRASRLLPRNLVRSNYVSRCYAVPSSDAAASRSMHKDRAKTGSYRTNEGEDPEVMRLARNELAFLRSLFEAAAIRGRLSREVFFSGKDVRFLLTEKLVDEGMLRELWDVVAENASAVDIGFEQYLALHLAIDQLVDVPDNLSEYYRNVTLPDYTVLREISPAETTLPGVYDDEMREFLKAQFEALSGGQPVLSFKQFARWKPMLASCLRLGIALDAIKEMWAEHVPRHLKQSGELDVHGFIAFNARLDKLLDDFRQAVVTAIGKEDAQSSIEQKRHVYERWFTELTQGARLLSLDDLMSSRHISDRVQAGILSADRLQELFNTFPYEAGHSATEVGITRESFVRLMLMVEAEMRESYRTIRVERPPVQQVIQETDARSQATKVGDLASFGFDQSARSADEDEDRDVSTRHAPQQDVVGLQDAVLDLVGRRDTVFFVNNNASDQTFLRRVGGHIFSLTSSEEWRSHDATSVARLLVGEWQLVLTNVPSFCERGGISAFCETLPTARFAGLTESISLSAEGARSGTVRLVEKLSLVTGGIAVAVAGKWDLLEVPLPTGSAPRISQRNRFDRLTLGNSESQLDDQQQNALQGLQKLDIAFVGEKLKVLRERSPLGSIMIFKKLGL